MAKVIAAWNQYFDHYNQEPQTGTQFQRWVADSHWQNDITFSEAYNIFDKYCGKGKIDPPKPKYNNRPPLQLQTQFNNPSNMSSKSKSFSPRQQRHTFQSNTKNGVRFHISQPPNPNQYKPQNNYSNAPNNHYQNRSRTQSAYAHKNPNPNIRSPNSPNINPSNYNQLNQNRNRTQSAFAHDSPNIQSPKPQKNTNNIQNMTETRRRSKTVPIATNIINNMNILVPNSKNQPLQVASNHIRVYSLSPKESKHYIPKDDLSVFLLKHDMRDLKRKLKESKIELKHLVTLEASDLNDLCKDLKFSTPERIRFKHAVKELQKERANGSKSVPVRENRQYGLRQSEADKYNQFSPAYVEAIEENVDSAVSPDSYSYSGGNSGHSKEVTFIINDEKLSKSMNGMHGQK